MKGASTLQPALILLAALALTLSTPLSTHAQQSPSVVIAPPFVKGALPDSIAAGITSQLEESFTAKGWQVVGLVEALALAVPTPGPCNNNTCALAYAEAAQVETALQLSIFLSSTGVTFSLALVQPPGDAFVHHGTMADPYHPAQVLTAAADDIVAQRARGPGPWLVVKGTPIDAAVRLDGQVIGVVPLRRRISGGEHVLVVSADGFADHNDTVWIDSDAGATKEVQVELEPVPLDKGTTHTDGTFRLHWAQWAGTAGMVLGSAYLLAGILHSTESGDCIDRAAGKCIRYADAGDRATMQLALGAPLTVIGLGFVIGGTIAQRRVRLSPAIARTEAGLNLSAEF